MFKLSAWLRCTFLAITAFVLTIACTQQPKTNAPDNSSAPTAASAPLVSAAYNWVGYSGHYVSVKKGLFTQEGLNVQDLFFQSASEEITAVLAGKADIAWLTSGDAIQTIAKDPSLKIAYLVDYSNGADGIIGRNIATPKDAKGKNAARENVLFEKVLLQAYLKQGGLTEADLKIKDMEAGAAAAAFGSKQVDLAVTYEPYLTKNAKLGGGNIIFSSKDTNLIADVVVVRDKLIKTRSKDLQSYFKAVDKAVKLVMASDPEALKISGDKMGVTAAEVKEQLAGVKLFDVAANKTIAFDKSNPKSLIGNLELTTKAAEEFKFVTQPLKVESLYDDSIVKSM
ncbi:ABC transporter substrate-binding protein [Chamaesiphon minutus]|uniref:ABC-type nitrate/sulfonate/bicarbonate transport system, periplasmic component n=1 Tax=Chamaesiphon minutus (strain ATCC 27169 / PCC 6605) TaxID=1173020 RepID=K9ULB9_CHAP6|nr:ABC transporter substrate-binding protein [Chamaesiphon minutus]AFY95453.1 ABC-type nitrate/sulfonate/bicarbonate transport system, periplasmic component [Chamaesiphon minutus PCC 6605]